MSSYILFAWWSDGFERSDCGGADDIIGVYETIDECCRAFCLLDSEIFTKAQIYSLIDKKVVRDYDGVYEPEIPLSSTDTDRELAFLKNKKSDVKWFTGLMNDKIVSWEKP